jgi:hypothetical protein
VSAQAALLPGAAGRLRQASDLLLPGFGNVSLSVVFCHPQLGRAQKSGARPFFFGRGAKVLS